MREAIGNSFLTYMVIIFTFLILGFLVASFSYSKAFKVKNKIINTIEKYNGFTDKAQEEIRTNLLAMGYNLNSNYFSCSTKNNATLLYGNVKGQYHYCLYERSTSRGKYYEVISYMHFDIPVIGEKISVPVHGESRIIYQDLKG